MKREYIYNVGYGWNIKTGKMCSFADVKGKSLAVCNHSIGHPNYRILYNCNDGGCVLEGSIDSFGVSFCECELVEYISEERFLKYKRYNEFE